MYTRQARRNVCETEVTHLMLSQSFHLGFPWVLWGCALHIYDDGATFIKRVE